MADKISQIYSKAVQKGVLADGMTEEQFREKTSTEKGLRSFYDYATSHGMKFHEYDVFKQNFYGDGEQETPATKQPEEEQQQASKRQPSMMAGFQEAGIAMQGEQLTQQEQAAAEQRQQDAETQRDAELHERFRMKQQQAEPVNPLTRGPIQNNVDFSRRLGIQQKPAEKLPMYEMKEQMQQMRQEHAQEVHDRRYQNKDDKPKDSYMKDLFESWQAGVGEIALTPFKAIEAAEDFGMDIENKIRGTHFQHGTGTATRFFNKVFGIDYLRSQVEHYGKEADRYQDGKGITETALEGDLGTAAGKAVLSTIQSAPNLAVSIYSGKKGLETLGGVFLGTTAALQKYDEIKDREDIDNADKALAMFGAFVSECVPEIIGAKRYGKMFNQKTVGTLRKETQKEVMNAWQKFVNSNTVKNAGRAWDWFMKYFGEGTTEAMTDVMNLGIDLALGIKDGVTKKDLMNIGDSFIVGQLSDAMPSGVHFYQQKSYEHSVKKEIEASPMLMHVTQKLDATPEEIANIASKVVYQENVSDKEEKLFNEYQQGISDEMDRRQVVGYLMQTAGLAENPNAYSAYEQAVSELNLTDDEVAKKLLKDPKKYNKSEKELLNTIATRMNEIAKVQQDTQEVAAEQQTQQGQQTVEEPQVARPVLSTGTKPLEFTIKVKEESRESGKTSEIMKDVKISFQSQSYTLAEDGAIESDAYSILVNGKPLTGNKKREYLGLINDQLREEKTKNDEAVEAARLEEERKKTEEYQRQQHIAEMQAQLEQQKAEMRESVKGVTRKNGEINLNEATPEQVVFFLLEHNGDNRTVAEKATVDIATSRIVELHAEKEKKGNAIEKWQIQNKIDGYYAAIQKWIGTEATEAARAAVNNELGITEDEVPGTIESEGKNKTEDEGKQKPAKNETKQEPKEEPKTEKLEARSDEVYDHIKVETKEQDGVKTTKYIPYAKAEGAEEATPIERAGKFINRKLIVGGDAFRVLVNEKDNIRDIQVQEIRETANGIEADVIISFKTGTYAPYSARLSEVPKVGSTKREQKPSTPPTEAPETKAPKKPKAKVTWPNPFDENIALVKTANGRVVFKSRAEIKDGETEYDPRIVYAKEGSNYIPYAVRSAKQKISLNSTVPVVDANGVEKSVYANQLYADTNGDKPFVENQNTKLKVDNFGQVAAYPVYTSANGTQFTLQDLLTEHKRKTVNEDKKTTKTETVSGYEYVRQQVEAENPDDPKAIETLHKNIKHILDMWNVLAGKLLDSKGYNKAMLLAYRYLYYSNAISNAIEKENYTEAHRIDALIDGKVDFSIGTGFDPKNLKGKALNNPLYRLASMIEITKDMPEMKGVDFDMQLPEDIEKALKAKIITAKQIEERRDEYKKLLAKKDKTDAEVDRLEKLEKLVPEVKTAWAPLTREQSEKGFDKVKPLLKQEAGETRLNRKMSKEQEALKNFRDLCQEAINALRSNNKVLFNKLNAQIGNTVMEHMADKVNKFANQMVSYQNSIRNILTTAFPEVAEIAKRHKRLDSALNEQSKRINEADEALQDVKRLEGELEGLKAMGNTEDVLKQIETTSKRLESAREKLAAKEARRDEPMLQDVRKLTEELSTYQAEHPEAEQQYQEMSKQEFPEGGLRIEFQTGDENVPMAEFTETEKKSKQARLAYNALVAALQRVKGLNLHMVGSQTEARRVLEMIQGNPMLMSVFHGTTADFDAFDFSFVGTGEGAQAYGYGGYVSKKYGVGVAYARADIDRKKREAKKKKGLMTFGKYEIRDDYDFHNFMHQELGLDNPELTRDAWIIFRGIETAYKSVVELHARLYSNGKVIDTPYEYIIESLNSDIERLKRWLKEERLDDEERADYTRQLGANEAVYNWMLDNQQNITFSKPITGQLMYVEIPDDTGENYIRWDSILQQPQREHILKKAYEEGLISEDEYKGEYILNDYGIRLGLYGGALYEELTRRVKHRQGAKFLSSFSVFGHNIYDFDATHGFSDAFWTKVMDRFAEESGIKNLKMPRGRDHQGAVISFFRLVRKERNERGTVEWDSVYRHMAEWYGQAVSDEIEYYVVNDQPLSYDKTMVRADKVVSDWLSSIGYTGIKVPINYTRGNGYTGEENMNYVIFNEDDMKITKKEVIEYFKAPDGTIYGWSIGNDMYLTDEGLNPETPIHEYTHIWLNALKVGNKAAYDKVLRAIKARKGLWEKVTKDPAYAHLTTPEEIASEVLARYSGKRGAARLMEVANELYGQNPDAEPTTLTKTFISKMQSILKEFWDAVKGLFGIKSMDDISDWVLKDLFDGKPLDFNTEEMQAIKDKAKADGTFMKTPDGRPTKLTEKQWLQVRTKAFKEWYGDWENPKEGEFFLLDGNEYVWDEAQQKYTFVLKGEPQLAYHGTEYAGYDIMDPKDYDELDENGNPKSSGRGIFMTPQQFVAGVYAGLTGEDVTDNEALIGDDPHRGIYSLYNNMHNPLIVNCADEEGNASMWHSIPTGIWKIVGGNMPTQYFNSYDEAVEAYYEQGWGINPEGTDLEEPELVPETHTTDEFVELARAQGYDGVIFMNVIDGTDSKLLDDDVEGRDYMRAHDVYVALAPNQVKSATQNKGLFSMEDARIEYQYTDAQLTELDEPTEKRIRKEEDKGTEHMLDPDMSDQERESWWESVVTRIADQSNGMRLMLNSINAYRKLQGLEPLDMDKYDVRTKFEACRSIIANKVGFLERGIQMELDDTIREMAEVVENSQFYKDHMKEVGGDKPATLTPVQFIERYLMARNNWERAKEGVARGLAEFKERMGMGVIEFSNAFTDAYGEQAVLNLWDKIRAMTDFALDTNFEGGMISEELYLELKAKKFYVPQRGFWDDVNPENEEEGKEDLLQRRQRGNSIARNKLDSMHKAEGGKSLAEGCLAYIARDARQAIKLSEENKVKKVMFDLLRDNEDWCHLPEHNFKVPRQVFYETNEDGEIVRMDDGPTDEQRKLMNQLKGIIKDLKEQYQKADTDEEREAIQEEIYATEAQFPYFDEKDSYRILHTRAKTNKALVGLYINGVPCEIEMTPRFIQTADALNGRRNKRGEISALKTVTSWLSAQFTMNNPTFFAVNITRDTPLILTKGAVEYGPEFSARFTANWAVSQKAIWTYLLKGEIDNTDTGAQLRDFLMNGGNTGYSNLEELERWRRRVSDLNPGGSLSISEIADKLSTLKGAKELGVDLLKGTLKVGDKAIGWAELRPLAKVLNEWSEIISRFSAYKSVVDMGLGVNEGIKAAHNLSTNFNRRGLGAPFINFFNSLTVFANAGIQGASGYWRTLDAQGGAGEKAKKIAKTAAYMGMLPAFLGFVATMFNPDDDEYEYMVSEYERDNYIILGDKRLALNEQLKPWWVIGVNAALLCRGKRTLKQAANSVLTSMFTNWLPLPQNLTGSINMLTENITGKEEWNIAQIARQAIMPSAMQTMNQWADNKNFLGGKLRYDIGDIPEYEMAPNEAALYRDLAKLFYTWGGGNELVPSKTKEDGSKIRRWWDVNPKEIKSNTFWIPSGALDNFCLAYGLAKDIKERIEGDYHGTNVRVKDLPVINRFYKPSDKTLYRYAVVREARDIVQRHDDRINNLEKQVKHFSDVYAKTGAEEAKASLDEAKRLLTEEKRDVTATKMKKVLDKYNKKSIRALQNKLGESNKELKLYHEGAVEKLDETEYKLVQMLTEGVNLKKGLRHSTDVPEWIQWFDDHSGPRQDRRE